MDMRNIDREPLKLQTLPMVAGRNYSSARRDVMTGQRPR
jgi:hypothetical protein